MGNCGDQALYTLYTFIPLILFSFPPTENDADQVIVFFVV
jgi:hypothetical protein